MVNDPIIIYLVISQTSQIVVLYLLYEQFYFKKYLINIPYDYLSKNIMYTSYYQLITFIVYIFYTSYIILKIWF